MADFISEDSRLEALCKSLGHLWSDSDVIDVTDGIFEEKLAECKRTLLGKLYSRPNINFQAFISTMKWAWRTENVSCILLAPGFFSFSFKSAVKKQRVLDASPWSFSSNLLVLCQCDPDIPECAMISLNAPFGYTYLAYPLVELHKQLCGK